MKKLVVLADWAIDPLYRHEFETALTGYLLQSDYPEIQYEPVRLNTFETGYLLAQFCQTEERNGRPQETVYYVGSDYHHLQDANDSLFEGDLPEHAFHDQMVIARLASGLHLFSPIAGYSLSFVQPKLHHLFTYTEESHASLDREVRFAPRDRDARVLSHLLMAQQDEMELDELHQTLIPKVYDAYVGYLDYQGNLLTTLGHADLKGRYLPGDQLLITIGGVTHRAVYHEHFKRSPASEISLSPGATGSNDDPYLVLRSMTQQTAATLYRNPHPGTRVSIE